MEKINNLTQILNTIEQHSSSILTKAVPIFKFIDREPNTIIESIRERLHNHLSDELIIKAIQDVLDELITDARFVREEIDSFVESVLENDTDSIMKTEFLASVWFGDYSDGEYSGYEALVNLEKDLNNYMKRMSYEGIVDMVIEKINRR